MALQAGLLLAAFRLGLWLLPFRLLRHVVESQCSGRNHCSGEGLEGIVRAIMVARPWIPAATCLTQALAVQLLLRRHGYAPALRIGVARGPNDDLKAHAWVECAGSIIIGDLPELHSYTALTLPPS